MELGLRILIISVLVIIVFIVSCLVTYEMVQTTAYKLDDSPVGACVGEVNHCGCCGSCSTLTDYNVYLTKNNTLTEEARKCALDNLFGDSDKCMEEIGLTPGCAYCWAENVRCTRNNCWFPCLVEQWLGISPNQNGTLSKCFSCDEAKCLDGFIHCAGMSRRRAGIETDIARDISEVCNTSALNINNNCSKNKH